ncbi:MAG TPA: hypothetical protein VNF68_10750 [Candidatus Baltobacteraceae bacterium]|nr:hypothetical protein [Candidatus Baltobacteraceae bacterium]
MKRLAAGVSAVLFALLIPAIATSAAPSATTEAMGKLEWRSIGPYIGGRVVAVAGVPSQPNLFYMGAVQGGVWKSDDYGQSWENLTDGKIPGIASSIGAIAVAPSNAKIIYAGTGENDIRGDFSTGDGIYKSTDGGSTWHYAGLRETHMTSSIVIDPRDPNVAYATSMGHVFAPNPERGVFKTTDGGKTWKKILYVDENTGANTVVMDVRNPNVLYVSMWQAQRSPWNLTSGGPGSAIYKSIDAGAHWTKISSNPGFARGILGKMGVAVAPSDPRVVYAIVQAKKGGVFRSADGGATWKRVNANWKLRQRAFYYMAIYVDPTNANTVYAPNVDSVWKSTNGGANWKPLMPPGDHHIIWINPKNTQVMIEGDDGGATVSVNGGKTWSSELNQPTGQFYHIALDNQFPYHVYGAQQDDGAFEGPSASNEGLGIGAWHSVALGESTYIAVDPRDPNVTYGAGYFSSLVRLNTATGDEKNISPWPLYLSGSSSAQQKYRFGWTHPILFSPAKPDELFETAQVVFKSDDFGNTWNAISPDLTRNDKSTQGPSGGPVYLDQTGVETFPDISSFAISPKSADVMWAGSADGLVHVSADGGTQWKLVTPPALPQWAQISSIEPSHVDPATAYLTASRYQWDDFHPYVYKTIDYGAHWTTLTTGIPQNQYTFVVREDPRDARVLFAGTRSTVYVSLDSGARWQPLTLNLPGVQMRDIAIDARQGEVAVATHGRGFWILDNLALLEQLASGTQSLYAPETAWLSHAYGGGGFGGGNSGTNPKYGASVFFDVPTSYNGKTKVTLSFLDANGKTVRTFDLHLRDKHQKKLPGYQLSAMTAIAQNAYHLARETAIEPGANVFQWDLRYAPPAEIRGARAMTTDDFSDAMNGPTVVPGTYTAVLDYGGSKTQQTFAIALDPRLHPAAGALDARLALASRIAGTLDELDRTVNATLAARSRMPAVKRAQADAILRKIVEFRFASSEADVMIETQLRDHLAFLMNELDLAYQAPTAAESATYDDLRTQADAAIASLRALTQ